ncbi:MAG: AraC family transcriptional regulator [Clostridia bacterium]|nr:AraC family transcriptional regulator [Clostridia bacterium]
MSVQIKRDHENGLLRVFYSAVDDKYSSFDEHHHTACEITMVLSGCGIYAAKSAEFDFKKGDVFFFSTDEIHWIKKLNEPATFLNIHFEPRFIWSDTFGISNAGLIKIFFNRKGIPLNKLNTSGESISTIQKLIFDIDNEISSKKAEYATMVKIHLVNILIEMIRSYDGKLDELDISSNSQALRSIENAINYIDSNLESDITLDALSDAAHMSKTYFCSQFKKLNGISPWEYITIKRIERSIMLMESTNLTKLEIAIKCGYNNTSNFYHAFKRVTGKSPRDYKRF